MYDDPKKGQDAARIRKFIEVGGTGCTAPVGLGGLHRMWTRGGPGATACGRQAAAALSDARGSSQPAEAGTSQVEAAAQSLPPGPEACG
jgi:hypothetical protein